MNLYYTSYISLLLEYLHIVLLLSYHSSHFRIYTLYFVVKVHVIVYREFFVKTYLLRLISSSIEINVGFSGTKC